MGEFLTKIKDNKILFVSLVALLLIVLVTEVIVVFYLKYEISNNKEEVVFEETVVVEEEQTKIYVEIKGAVKKPGTYEVKSDKRVIDIIKLAEGLLENAYTNNLNLSKKVVDEMVIVVYTKEQVANFIKIKEEEELSIEKCHEDSLTSNNACLDKVLDDNEKDDLISINTATVDELMTLPGIGEAKALSIVNYRNDNGLFESIEDLKNVTGIGESIYAQIENFITT